MVGFLEKTDVPMVKQKGEEAMCLWKPGFNPRENGGQNGSRFFGRWSFQTATGRSNVHPAVCFLLGISTHTDEKKCDGMWQYSPIHIAARVQKPLAIQRGSISMGKILRIIQGQKPKVMSCWKKHSLSFTIVIFPIYHRIQQVSSVHHRDFVSGCWSEVGRMYSRA